MSDDFTNYIVYNFACFIFYQSHLHLLLPDSSLLNTSQYLFQTLRCSNVVFTVQTSSQRVFFFAGSNR